MKSFREAYLAPIPSPLFRHFEDERHAQDFLKGNFRMGYYKSYTSLAGEDIRRNAGEGMYKGAIIRPSGKASSAIVGGTWPMYVLCCFSPDTDSDLRYKHGDFVIRINDPLEFHRRIISHIGKPLSGSFLGNMVYQEKLHLDDEKFEAPIELHAYSDSLGHSAKKEVRFTYYLDAQYLWPPKEKAVTAFNVPLPNYIELVSANVGNLCELLW